MRRFGANMMGLAIAIATLGAHAQHVTGSFKAVDTNGKTHGTVIFECTGNDPCVGTFRAIITPPECTNSITVSDRLVVTGGVVPTIPGAVSVNITASNANPDNTPQPDGSCTFFIKPQPDFIRNGLGGRWDGQQGTLDGDRIDGDGTHIHDSAIYTVDATPPFQMTVSGNVSAPVVSASATVQFAPNLVGTMQSVYVFAMAPPSIVKSTTQAKVDASLPCVLAQLNQQGQLVAVSAASLAAYVTGVVSSAQQAYNIVNNVPQVNIAGATFFLGVGTDGNTATGGNNARAAGTVPALNACKAEKPQTGWWWYDKEAGRGFSIEARNSNLFFAGYLYDASGQATWVAAAGPTALEGSVFQSDLLAFANGQSMGGAYKSPAAQASPGRITLTFSDAQHGVLSWPGGNVGITRFEMVPSGLGLAPRPSQPENGWWWNESETGRGYFIEWQGANAFLATYLYTPGGSPIWYATQAATPDMSRLSGALTTYTGGQTLTGAYRAPTGQSSAGNVGIVFTGPETATLTWPGGQQVPIKRFRF